MDRGIVLTGGGALLRGLDELIRAETRMPVHVADAPLAAVVLGAGKCVEEFDALKQVLVSSDHGGSRDPDREPAPSEQLAGASA